MASKKTASIADKFDRVFDPAQWQVQGKSGEVYQLTDLSRNDLIQVACQGMQALEALEDMSIDMRKVLSDWRKGRMEDSGE